MSAIRDWFARRSRRCSSCRAPLVRQLVVECRGSTGAASVRLRNLPVLACNTDGHPKRYCDPDFGADLTEKLFYSSDVPISRTGLAGRQSCHRCAADLPGRLSAEAVDVSGRVVLADSWEIEMSLQAPGTRCPRCAAEQILASGETSDDISNAIVEAFRSVHLAP